MSVFTSCNNLDKVSLSLNSSFRWGLNPILGGGGGDKFTLSAPYRVKSPESGPKVGVMGYQNSIWDTCDLTKEVPGPKNY